MMSARQNAVLRRFNQSLNNWNVINVRNMNRMFKDARSFNQPLNNWNVSKVTDMDRMFAGATSLVKQEDMEKIAKRKSYFSRARLQAAMKRVRSGLRGTKRLEARAASARF